MSTMQLYGQYCPIARAAEILTDRWTVLVIRELLADVRQFNELHRGLPRMSRALLADRLRRLADAGVVEHLGRARGRSGEYCLTEAGRELQPIVDQLGAWGARWAFGDPRPQELDPVVLLWWMRRRVLLERIPRHRIVIEFRFGPRGSRRYWLLIEGTDVSVCLKPPGHESDVIVSGDLAAFYRIWLGRASLSDGLRSGSIRLDGTSADVRAFPRWFAFSPMAAVVRAMVNR